MGPPGANATTVTINNIVDELGEPLSCTFNASENATDSTVQCIPGTTPPPPPVEEICGDGIDNDGDGQVDEDCPPVEPPVNATLTDSLINKLN
jgi:hypothetical protein